MPKLCLAFLGMILLVISGIAFADDPYQVGEKWVYQGDGFKPYSNREAIKGDSIQEIVEVKEIGGEKYWLLKHYGEDNPSDFSLNYLDIKKQVHKIDLSLGAWLNYEKALPFYYALKPGEKLDYETKTDINGEPGKMRVSIQRLADETVKVPAGTFENCIHLKRKVNSMFDIGLKHTCTIESWYHDSVNNEVKSIMQFEDGTAFDFETMGFAEYEGYKYTSELKSYTCKKHK